MNNNKLMDTNRLEAFYDAIIAIIVTVLVLGLRIIYLIEKQKKSVTRS